MAALASDAARVKDQFQAWDATSSGLILREQLAQVLQRLCPGVAESEVGDVLHGLDTAGDGRLRLEEFLQLLYGQVETSAASSGAAIDEAELERARERGLWEQALADARARALRARGGSPQVALYFDDVRDRLSSEEYASHVQSIFFNQVDANQDGTISYEEAASIIGKTLSFAADMGIAPKPTKDEVKAAFDAHDTLAMGRGRMGDAEFLNLAKYLQVRVAEAMLPLTTAGKSS